ncbi:hypothetical protein M427DRAFT_57753 [Gonapodya prolifera JEL478]|uniref:Uncharacterized protein n=1 Tax=Gonapodya prolifera (strain JEL478) TaxID=1344416 RepID=A0A139AC94_GONPJ|nr:hypothetical protein M427DRAFT_57753 [Gonapodya prolifera JEL478]|eukprot:KXS14279.1 hypothetical protein M427DRAFT_57753 [Gonapodya prolifera JEL478]
MCFSFIGLHIYYLRKHYANSTMFTTSMQANKLTATLKLFGNSIGVLLVDGITHAFRDYVGICGSVAALGSFTHLKCRCFLVAVDIQCSKQGPVYFFALVFGGQIIKDFICESG